MSGCRDFARLIAAGRADEFETHRASCRSCAEIAREMETTADAVASLRAPAMSRALSEALYAIPQRTVHCEAAADLLARAADDAIAPAEARRLEFHLSRCPACSESAAVLGAARALGSPQPAPWLATRLAAVRPAAARRKRSFWSQIASPKGAIAIAYAAAVLVMVLGFNPADLARKAGTARLEQTAKSGVETARNTLADRFGALQERAFRAFEVAKGRVGGYSRAALTNAIALVMRSDTPRRPSRPRNDDGSGAWNPNTTEFWTWRAERAPGGES
jgi:putative zinc finger protein